MEYKKKVVDVYGMGTTFNNIGVVFEHTGDLDKALEFYNKSLEIKKRTGDRQGTALALNNIAGAHEFKGELNLALSAFKESLRLRKEIGAKYGTAFSTNQIGALNTLMGNKDEALRYCILAVELSKKIDEKSLISNSYVNLGDAYLAKGSQEKAIENYKKALKIKKDTHDLEGQAYAMNHYSEALCTIEKFDESLIMGYRALEVADSFKGTLERGMAMMNIGSALTSLGEYEDAKRSFDRAKDILGDTKSRRLLTVYNFQLGSLAFHIKDIEKARMLLTKVYQDFSSMGMKGRADKTEKMLEILKK